VPLVYQAKSWEAGVYLAATVGSETTAAAAGTVGQVRRDPFAMLPFCGYNMADYFTHWLKMGKSLKHPPALFGVNWFRKGEDGKYLWPGFGENVRVLDWMLGRLRKTGKSEAVESPLGWIPSHKDINLKGVESLSSKRFDELMSVSPDEWRSELASHESLFDRFGDRLPSELRRHRLALASEFAGGGLKHQASRAAAAVSSAELRA
jgi:phosphoenolpyruvate carboxykinase (GTP)